MSVQPNASYLRQEATSHADRNRSMVPFTVFSLLGYVYIGVVITMLLSVCAFALAMDWIYVQIVQRPTRAQDVRVGDTAFATESRLERSL